MGWPLETIWLSVDAPIISGLLLRLAIFECLRLRILMSVYVWAVEQYLPGGDRPNRDFLGRDQINLLAAMGPSLNAGVSYGGKKTNGSHGKENTPGKSGPGERLSA
jgi:hypothetical protein